jgi:predicted metal-dependent hydrolase
LAGLDAPLVVPPVARPRGTLRSVLLEGQRVDYRLLRARRRSIGMEVHLDGLTVRAPRWVTLRDVEAALVERARWILRALEHWKARRREVMPREWKTGARLVYRGRELALALFPSRHAAISADLFDLTVRHPAAHDGNAVGESVRTWLRGEALALVAARVPVYATQVGRAAPDVRLSDARSEWGSCNARGIIRLNWRLVQLPPALAEYVVVHEVAHMVELNHSARFWSLVESLLPGHAALRRALDDWTALLAA